MFILVKYKTKTFLQSQPFYMISAQEQQTIKSNDQQVLNAPSSGEVKPGFFHYVNFPAWKEYEFGWNKGIPYFYTKD